jgi:MYXO-CTERM domain-containing protein
VELGLDPLNPDTDGGGVPDGEEVQRGSDPLDPSDDFPEEQPPSAIPGQYLGGACVGCANSGSPMGAWLLGLLGLGLVRRRR